MEAPKMEELPEMELREFVEIALRDIFEGTKDAQKLILHGEIIPNKDGKTGEADIDFEIAVKPKDNRLIVATQPAPPMQIPNKVRFKIPVRLPKRRGFILHLISYCFARKKKPTECSAPDKPQAPADTQKGPQPEEPPKAKGPKPEAPRQ